MENRHRKTFGTRGPVNPTDHYVVSRAEELADFINRVKEGRYIVLFAPRQTGKTTFFRNALDALAAEEPAYVPIQLNFEVYEDVDAAEFYADFHQEILMEIEDVFQKRDVQPSADLSYFLAQSEITNHLSMERFFKRFTRLLSEQAAGAPLPGTEPRTTGLGEINGGIAASAVSSARFPRIVLVIDEFDGIPPTAAKGFLHTLRRIYLTRGERCIHSVGIVGVKSIKQLNTDRTISPFNIQDEFALHNFTLPQVNELLSQYTAEVGQPFSADAIAALHRQTGGQPFLVNRLAQILTEEMDLCCDGPKVERITLAHFAKAHTAILEEINVNFEHLTTNIRRDLRFERFLMEIASSEEEVLFNPRNDVMRELAAYGVIAKGSNGRCEIVNPIYHYCIMQAFQPAINGLEEDYFPEDTGAEFSDYLTADGQIDLTSLLDNFRDFIARIGFRILQVPEIPKESVGQYLLATYLDAFVRAVRGDMYLELPTGRGRMDLVVFHNGRKYVVEIKVWHSARRYEGGKQQLAAYLKSEGISEGYYVVFDRRKNPEPRVETETIDGLQIRSYVIPVLQERPSDLSEEVEGYGTYRPAPTLESEFSRGARGLRN